MSVKTMPRLEESLEQRFQRLLATWQRETAFHSSSTIRREHAAYQEIIALGHSAVPLLLGEMDRNGNGHLSHALKSVAGQCPVMPEHPGRVQEVADDWVRWGKKNGYR